MEMTVARSLHDDLMAGMPEGARHNNDICQFCVEKASTRGSTASDPSGSGRPDVSQSNSKSTEGGTKPTMADISQETHEALLKKAVEDAVQATTAALQTKTTEAADAAKNVEELSTENAELKTEAERLNKELDSAQVKLTSATEEMSKLKTDIEKVEEDARIAEVASKRGDQVKNLKLFPEEYVSEKASKWAVFDEAAWNEQLEEWKQLKPASTEGSITVTTEVASAMSGTTENLTKEQQEVAAATTPNARRAVLGLVN